MKHLVHPVQTNRLEKRLSQQTGLVTNDTNGNGDDIFLYDIATQAKSLVSVNLTGTSGITGGSFKPSISDDGHYLAFESFANGLVSTADETNGFTTDVFVLTGTKQVVVKLPDGVAAPTDLWITVSIRGLTSNRALVKIKP